jgi:hypothetical protein
MASLRSGREGFIAFKRVGMVCSISTQKPRSGIGGDIRESFVILWLNALVYRERTEGG